MPVIINELEIVVEPPEEPAPEAAQPAAGPVGAAPGAMDITDLLERRARLSRRLVAH